jgi:hypothetical protein
MMNWKVLERKQLFHNKGTNTELAARTEENNEEPLIACGPAENRTEHLPHTT